MDGRSSTVDPIKIIYSFRFQNGLMKEFPIVFDRETLALIMEDITAPPVWTDLNYNKCSICTLDEVQNKYCPIALNLVNINEEFKDSYSYEDVSVSGYYR